jgi:hypothetical protein
VNNWTKERLDKAIRLLASGKHDSVASVAKQLGSTKDALDRAFTRNGMKTPQSLLKANKAKFSDLVEEHVAKQNQQRERQLHKQMLEELQEARKRQRVMDALNRPQDPFSIERREFSSNQREATALVLASDWHVEETVTREQTSGRNEFNLQIAEYRIGRFFNGIKWLLEKERGKFLIRDVILALIGDFITGYIHEELEESNGCAPIEAVIFVRNAVASGIRELLADGSIATITIPCRQGNHGRTTKKVRASTGYKNSYEWLMYYWLKTEFANEPRVRFSLVAGSHDYVRVYDKLIHFTHGDEGARYEGGIMGISVPVMKQIARWNQIMPADLHCVGHFHQRRDFGQVLVNGSLIGTTAYGQRFGYEPPEQQFALIDSKRWVSSVSPIWVGDRED